MFFLRFLILSIRVGFGFVSGPLRFWRILSFFSWDYACVECLVCVCLWFVCDLFVCCVSLNLFFGLGRRVSSKNLKQC